MSFVRSHTHSSSFLAALEIAIRICVICVVIIIIALQSSLPSSFPPAGTGFLPVAQMVEVEAICVGSSFPSPPIRPRT